MKKKYKIAVYIGRFQPFHNGHLAVVQHGFEVAEDVMILIGSASAAPDIRNPFSYSERALMIFDAIEEAGLRSAITRPIDDHFNSDTEWLAQVHEVLGNFEAKDICLIGSKKDESSYYLDLFEWDKSFIEPTGVNATDIRNHLFNVETLEAMTGISNAVQGYLRSYIDTHEYDRLQNEWEVVKNYPYGKGPFLTADAVVICRGYILMIRRKNAPGESQWALPGGFVNQSERLKDACLRELKEETGLKVPLPVLYGSVKAEKLFDHPNRDRRARIVTQAYLIVLGNEKSLPKVKGGDDAVYAGWIKFSDLRREEVYSDHYTIIKTLISMEK